MTSSDRSITIVAGGWSALHLNLAKLRRPIIAVNDAARFLPIYPDIVVSMDRLWTENRWKWLAKREGITWIRASALQKIPIAEMEKAHQVNKWLTRFCCDHQAVRMIDRDEYSEPSLNGTNSGMCAMNLAYQMQPEKVYLVGFDMNRSPQGRPYWHAPYPWASYLGATSDGKYEAWAQQFDVAAEQFKAAGIRVFNVSESSAITSFKKIKPAEYAQK
jgi:hypothetical protein